MIKGYLIPIYAYLVKVEVWTLEGEGEKVVPLDYRLSVAEYLATQA